MENGYWPPFAVLKRGLQSDEHREEIYIVGARKGDASSEIGNGPDASIVLKVHIRSATGA